MLVLTELADSAIANAPTLTPHFTVIACVLIDANHMLTAKFVLVL